jgi:poly-beta-1,6-N-acetyl-D-glucosamine synthase
MTYQVNGGTALRRSSLWDSLTRCYLTTFGVFILAYNANLAIALPLSIVESSANSTAVNNAFLTAVAVWTFLLLVRWIIVQLLALRELHVRQKIKGALTEPATRLLPPISIVVPAYQEGENIEQALASLAELDYPHYEIIVVDDGSTDDTWLLAKRFTEVTDSHRIRVLTKPNGGKWSALNYGITHAKFDLLLCIDADSRLTRNALQELVRHMSDPAVAAVSGQVTVRNRTNLLTWLQCLEYVIANGGLRRAQSLFGSVLVVPGPIGLYRRSVFDEIVARSASGPVTARLGSFSGPLSEETFAEDFQLSLTVLALGHRIVYESNALAFTRAPATIQQLLNQRYRWMRGTMQVLKVYARRLKFISESSVRRRLGFVLMFFYAIDITLMPVLSITILIGFLIHLTSAQTTSTLFIWMASLWLSNLMSAAYFLISQKEDVRLAVVAPLMDVYHVLLVNTAWYIALFDETRKARMQW